MKAKELLFSHHYAEALKAYRQQMRDQPGKNLFDAVGEALLGLGEFEEALLSFRRNSEVASSRLKGNFPSLNKAGTALWLMGRQREAMSEWHKAAAGILDGTIQYGDLAGGGTQGLLLWYGAVTLKDEVERSYALEYLRGIASKEAWGNICWPRPVVLMVLGEKSFADVLEVGSGSPVLPVSIEKARTGLLARRQLCQTLFYAACQDRCAGKEDECLAKMRLCAQLENPIIECEWYLARAEASGK